MSCTTMSNSVAERFHIQSAAMNSDLLVMKTLEKTTQSAMRLYDRADRRLYLNASERERFLAAAELAAPHVRNFALTLFHTGCRLTEARELKGSSFQQQERVVAIHSLKKRTTHHIREIPIPGLLVRKLSVQLGQLERPEVQLWNVNRTTAYRWIKAIMEQAGIVGPQACPKGLRHGFGIHAIQSGIQITMLKKWMGHTSVETTAIYANAVGPEERMLARRMWK